MFGLFGPFGATYSGVAATYMMDQVKIRLTQPQVELQLGLSLANLLIQYCRKKGLFKELVVLFSLKKTPPPSLTVSKNLSGLVALHLSVHLM